jgi:hypothetical protein
MPTPHTANRMLMARWLERSGQPLLGLTLQQTSISLHRLLAGYIIHGLRVISTQSTTALKDEDNFGLLV